MTDHGPMSRAVAFALKHTPDAASLAAARALVRHYATLIDAAAVPATYADALAALDQAAAALEGPARTAALKAHRRIAAALSATTVAADLGPKLLAALTAIGGTAAATAAPAGTGGGTPGGNVVGSTLAGLRSGETRRKHRAPAMDAAAQAPNA